MFELHQPLAPAGNDPRCRLRRSNPTLSPSQRHMCARSYNSSYGLSVVGYGLIRGNGETMRHSCCSTRNGCRAGSCITSICRTGDASRPTEYRHGTIWRTNVDCINVVYSALGTRFIQQVFASQCSSRRAKSDQPTISSQQPTPYPTLTQLWPGSLSNQHRMKSKLPGRCSRC